MAKSNVVESPIMACKEVKGTSLKTPSTVEAQVETLATKSADAVVVIKPPEPVFRPGDRVYVDGLRDRFCLFEAVSNRPGLSSVVAYDPREKQTGPGARYVVESTRIHRG